MKTEREIIRETLQILDEKNLLNKFMIRDEPIEEINKNLEVMFEYVTNKINNWVSNFKNKKFDDYELMILKSKLKDIQDILSV